MVQSTFLLRVPLLNRSSKRLSSASPGWSLCLYSLPLQAISIITSLSGLCILV